MKTSARATVNLEVTLTINESEARALDALVGYGFKGFIEVFYKHMGQAYMRPHEKGLESFFDSVQSGVVPQLQRIDKARDAFDGKHDAQAQEGQQP